MRILFLSSKQRIRLASDLLRFDNEMKHQKFQNTQFRWFPHSPNKQNILGGDTNLFVVASGRAPGVKMCKINHAAPPAVVPPAVVTLRG